MAEKNFKVGESIEVIYQAGNGDSGLVINMLVVKPDKTFVSATPTNLTEIGNSGRYYGSFVPNAVGEWSVQVQRADGTGKMTKSFSVGDYHVEDLGAKLDLAVGKLNDQDSNLGVVQTKVDNVKGNTDKIPDMQVQLANVSNAIAALHSPAMIT